MSSTLFSKVNDSDSQPVFRRSADGVQAIGRTTVRRCERSPGPLRRGEQWGCGLVKITASPVVPSAWRPTVLPSTGESLAAELSSEAIQEPLMDAPEAPVREDEEDVSGDGLARE